MAIEAGPHGHTVDQQSPPARERHPRFAPRRRSRRCRSQPGDPRRRRRGTHLPAACPALTAAWSWSRSSRRSVQPPSIDRVCDRNRFVPNNASRTAARPRDAQYDSPQAQAVKQAAWRAAVNGMNFPPGRPCCPHYRGGLGPARHSSGCGGASPGTVGLLVNTPALPTDRGGVLRRPRQPTRPTGQGGDVGAPTPRAGLRSRTTRSEDVRQGATAPDKEGTLWQWLRIPCVG